MRPIKTPNPTNSRHADPGGRGGRLVRGPESVGGLNVAVGESSGESRPNTTPISARLAAARHVLAVACLTVLGACGGDIELTQEEQQKLDRIAANRDAVEQAAASSASETQANSQEARAVDSAAVPGTPTPDAGTRKPIGISVTFPQNPAYDDLDDVKRSWQGILASRAQYDSDYSFARSYHMQLQPTSYSYELDSPLDLRLFCEAAPATASLEQLFSLVPNVSAFYTKRVLGSGGPQIPPFWYQGAAQSTRDVVWEALRIHRQDSGDPSALADSAAFDLGLRRPGTGVIIHGTKFVSTEKRGEALYVKDILDVVPLTHRDGRELFGEDGLRIFAEALRRSAGFASLERFERDCEFRGPTQSWAPDGIGPYLRAQYPGFASGSLEAVLALPDEALGCEPLRVEWHLETVRDPAFPRSWLVSLGDNRRSCEAASHAAQWAGSGVEVLDVSDFSHFNPNERPRLEIRFESERAYLRFLQQYLSDNRVSTFGHNFAYRNLYPRGAGDHSTPPPAWGRRYFGQRPWSDYAPETESSAPRRPSQKKAQKESVERSPELMRLNNQVSLTAERGAYVNFKGYSLGLAEAIAVVPSAGVEHIRLNDDRDRYVLADESAFRAFIGRVERALGPSGFHALTDIVHIKNTTGDAPFGRPTWAPKGIERYVRDNYPSFALQPLSEPSKPEPKETKTRSMKLWLRPVSPKSNEVNAPYEVRAHVVDGARIVNNPAPWRTSFVIEVDDKKALAALVEHLNGSMEGLGDRMFRDFNLVGDDGGEPPNWATKPTEAKQARGSTKLWARQKSLVNGAMTNLAEKLADKTKGVRVMQRRGDDYHGLIIEFDDEAAFDRFLAAVSKDKLGKPRGGDSNHHDFTAWFTPSGPNKTTVESSASWAKGRFSSVGW